MSEIKLFKSIQGLLFISKVKKEKDKYLLDNPLAFAQTKQGIGFGEFLDFSKDGVAVVHKNFIENNFIEYKPEKALIVNYDKAVEGIKAKRAGIIPASSVDLKNLGNVTPFNKK